MPNFMKPAFAAMAISVAALPAAAELELSFYGGSQSAPHSSVSGSHPAIGDFRSTIGWQGKSFAAPPYYGVRAMWWRDSNIGWGVELTHAKAYAPTGEMAAAGFDALEFTDGHNILTLNMMKRWPEQWGRFTPYVGGGLGVAIPHVDIQPTGGAHTFGYQVTGPAVKLMAGAKYDLNDRWALFGEYQFTYSENKVDLDGGGDLDTRIITNAVNFGVSISF